MSLHKTCIRGRALAALFLIVAVKALSQAAAPAVAYNEQTKVFRLDAANVTYAFGINERGELQPLYWGGRLGSGDTVGPAHVLPDWASFDLTTGVTPQEFAGWGAGLYVEPALKITFPDGNRDLVLDYVSHHIDGTVLTVTVKDISREVY